MKKFTLVLLFILAGVHILNAQVHVRGVIRDAKDRSPLVGAVVYSNLFKEAVLSDSLGRYEILSLPGDELDITSLGYREQKIPIIDTSSFQYKYLEMIPVHYKLEGVTVLGGNEINPAFFMGKKSDIPIQYQNPYLEKVNYFTLGAPFSFPLVHFLYCTFSRQVKRDRKSFAYMMREARMADVYTIYTREMIAEVVKQEGKALDDFIVFCNANIKLLPDDTQELIKGKVLLQWRVYCAQQK